MKLLDFIVCIIFVSQRNCNRNVKFGRSQPYEAILLKLSSYVFAIFITKYIHPYF